MAVGQDAVSQRRLTHVAFVDDVTLVARSWPSLREMLTDLWEELQKYGLSLHPIKSKAQTNIPNWEIWGSIQFDEKTSLEVVPEGAGLKILGTLVVLGNGSTEEIRSRIAAGWKSIYCLKHMLLNRRIVIRRRLKLFGTTVASAIL